MTFEPYRSYWDTRMLRQRLICLHVMDRGALGGRSPLEKLDGNARQYFSYHVEAMIS